MTKQKSIVAIENTRKLANVKPSRCKMVENVWWYIQPFRHNKGIGHTRDAQKSVANADMLTHDTSKPAVMYGLFSNFMRKLTGI